MRKTAVDFFKEELERQLDFKAVDKFWGGLYDEAKEMEKEQNIEFAKKCLQENDCFFDIEQYYNKIFKTE